MPIIPLKHNADDILIQLGIAIHNLKNVPISDILSTRLFDADDNEISGLMALVQINNDLAMIGQFIADYIKAKEGRYH